LQSLPIGGKNSWHRYGVKKLCYCDSVYRSNVSARQAHTVVQIAVIYLFRLKCFNSPV